MDGNPDPARVVMHAVSDPAFRVGDYIRSGECLAAGCAAEHDTEIKEILALL